MLSPTVNSGKHSSLLGEYSALLADAVLRQRAREAEHTARLESELASKVKSEFIANMSHELRTPLNTVIGFAKLLGEHHKRRLHDREIVEYADLITGAAGHLLAVINDILDISKLQSGKYTLDAQEIDLKDVLQGSIASLMPTALTAGADIACSFDAELLTVKGDPAKLGQVFFNLISNAIRFTPKGGTIRVETRALQDGGVAVLVRDSGVGMSMEEIAVALTPFAQVEAGRTRWRDGTGLGLPIAKALVELHGGRLEIRSIRSSGTEVAVILPSRFHVSVTEARDVLLGAIAVVARSR